MILNLDQWLGMLFKDISYLEFWWPFCTAERNHLCSFRPGRYEEPFCEIILNLDQMSLKDIFYLELWWQFCSAEGDHLCNFW